MGRSRIQKFVMLIRIPNWSMPSKLPFSAITISFFGNHGAGRKRGDLARSGCLFKRRLFCCFQLFSPSSYTFKSASLRLAVVLSPLSRLLRGCRLCPVAVFFSHSWQPVFFLSRSFVLSSRSRRPRSSLSRSE